MFFAEGDWTRQINEAIDAPLMPRSDPGFAAGVSTAFSDSLRTSNAVAERLNAGETWTDEVQRFTRETGRNVGFPQSMAPARGGKYAQPWGQFRAEVDAWNAQNPDRPFALPTDDEMRERALARNRAAQMERQQLSEASQSLGSMVGGAIGDMGSMAVDPANVVAFGLLGSGPGVGILRAAAMDAAASGAGQVLNEGLTYRYRREMDPNYSTGDSARNVGEAALMGGAGGLALRGAIGAGAWGLRRAARAWRGLEREAPEIPISRETVDAGNAVETAAVTLESNPLGPEAETAHAAAMAEAYRAAARGTVADLPEDVAIAARELPIDAVNRRLRAEQPDLLDRLDTLTRQRDMNRETISGIDAELGQPEFSAVRRVMLAAEEQSAKVDRLQAAIDKAGSDAQRTRLQAQVDAATSKLEEIVRGIDRQALDRLEMLDAAGTARRAALADAETALKEHQATVEATRKLGLADYWADRHSPPLDTLPAETREPVGRIRQSVEDGRALPGVDIAADLHTATRIVDHATAEGRPLAEFIAGMDELDGVNPRVRALIGLMHDGPDLAARIPADEFAAQLKELADFIENPTSAAQVPARSPLPIGAVAAAESVGGDLPKGAAETAAMRDVAVNDARKLLLDMPYVEVPVEVALADGTTATVQRRLADVLADADNEMLAANELRACALGKRES